jgi:hypothetical protein
MTQQSNQFLYVFRGGIDPSKRSPEEIQQNMDAWWAWINDLRNKGHFEGGHPLQSGGKVLSGKRGRTVTDGPFAEGKEEVGGYMLISAPDLATATELAKECPILLEDSGTVEVRSIQQMDGL